MEEARSDQSEEDPIPYPDPRHVGSKGSVGALAEIEVAADLMARGFHVYRNLAPVGPVDMVAIGANGEVTKIQATMGRVTPEGSPSFGRHCNQPHWEVLAVAFHDRVRYYNREGTEVSPLGRGHGEEGCVAEGAIPPRARGTSPSGEEVVVAGQRTGRWIPRRKRSLLTWVPLPGHKGVYVRPWSAELGDAATPRPF